jgi:hypothetical protein
MKQLQVVAILLIIFSVSANGEFAAGKMYIGGSAWIYRDLTDYDGYELGYSQITIAPSFGYFIFDNGLMFGRLYYSKVSLDDGWGQDDPDATIRFAAGGKLFIQSLYGGGSLQYSIIGSESYTGVIFEGGVLVPITDYFFVDLGADLYWGLSEDEYRDVRAKVGFATLF